MNPEHFSKRCNVAKGEIREGRSERREENQGERETYFKD